MSSLEFEPPKYARVVVELRRRIESGEYPPGALLPSESQLVREFAVGRTTVVRALQMLQHDGWIEREHGRGSYVKGRPGVERSTGRLGLTVLDQAETLGSVTLVKVGRVEAPASVVAVVGRGESVPMTMRRWVGERDGIPSELVTCWFPADLVYGTDLDQSTPLPVGVRAHLRSVKKLRVDHIAEHLTARIPTSEEIDLLKIKKSEPVIAILATMHDASDAALFAAEVVLPGSLHELEDVYSVTN